MIDFLQRLAPVRPGDGSPAVALEPSRFAAERPLRVVPLAPAETSVEEQRRAAEVQISDSPGAPIVEVRGGDSWEETSDPVMRPTRPIARGVEQPAMSSTARVDREPDRSDRYVPEAWPPAHRNPVSTPQAVPTAIVPPAILRADPVGHSRRTLLPVEPAVADARAAIDAMDHGLRGLQQPQPAVLRTSPSSSSPMSAESLVSRASIGGDGRPQPVIHVTIDRLEVRAPSPAPPSARRPRQSNQGVSLAEYLRGSDHRPLGGAR